MSEQDAKQHEKLVTLYGSEAAGKTFRIIGEPWERFKSHFDFRSEDVFARRVDTSKPASEAGNFETYKRGDDGKEGVWEAAEYTDFDYYLIRDTDAAGNEREFTGRRKNSDLAPWDTDNFEVHTKDGWKTVDYNDIDKDAIKHVQKLKSVMYVPAALKEETSVTIKKKDQTVRRVKLELTKTGWEALQKIMNALTKAHADPKGYWYKLTYIEADKLYTIKDDDYEEMTEAEKAAGTTEDDSAAHSSLADLAPAGDPMDEIPF
jgi:hypothetical protein